MITYNTGSRKGAALCVLALTTAAMVSGCKKSPEKIDLTSTHTTVAETMAPTTAAQSQPETTAIETTAEASAAGTEAKNISTETSTYSSGKVSIHYPKVLNMEDTQKAAAIDELLKKNALSVLEAWEIQDEEDSLNISCQVLSADRNRLTVVYTGTLAKKDASYPTNVMYSNTIDMARVSDIGFDHFADPYTMAGYVLSGDCVFYNVREDVKAELMKVKNDTSLEAYTDMFTKADFPIEGAFPESFSYEHQGVIYFSIPVPHALGDYAIVMYAPDSK
ncbi:DUF4163 domain-containing protein [bacterium D16-54]|nr:DUF4163 domain-containing protein [bacterium D16-54]RKJ15855.1 DUF4163 domain-containing protein [bacterium D16-56]